MTGKKLGKVQSAVLAALRSHGYWSMGCGWHWGGWRNTERVMESLVRAGVATITIVTCSDLRERKTYRPVP